MIRLLPRVLVLGLYCAASTISLAARADSSIGFLADQLKNATDFQGSYAGRAGSRRFRRQVGGIAALRRARRSPTTRFEAPPPPRSAGSRTPRVCAVLKAHLSDTSPSVRSVVERSAKALGGGKPGKPPLPGPNDTFYVAIGPVTDKTGRGDKIGWGCGRLGCRRSCFRSAGRRRSVGREQRRREALIKRHGLTGFFLRTRVEEPVGRSHGAGAGHHVVVPGRALVG